MAEMRARSAAFTVLELVVVVGILGVLLGLTVPALTTARRSTHQVVCANNLRQVGAGIAAFSGDERGRLPYVESPLWKSGGGQDWDADAGDAARYPHAIQRALAPYLGQTALFRCPAALRGYPQQQPSMTYREAAANNTDGRVYFNGLRAGTSFERAYANAGQQYLSNLKFLDGRLADVRHYDRASGKFVDTAGPYYLLRDFNDVNEAGTIRAAHGERPNQLYLDLHVNPTEDATVGLTYP